MSVGQTVLFTTSLGHTYLIDGTGVLHKPMADIEFEDLPSHSRSRPRAWSLIDASADIRAEWSKLVSCALFAVIVTPPNEERYRKWYKNAVIRFIADPWDIEELAIL